MLQAGHEVVMSAPTPFGKEIERCGLAFRDMGGDPQTSELAGANVAKLVMAAVAPRTVLAMGTMVLDTLRDDQLDVLLLSPFAEFGGHPLAEARGIPSLGVRLQPLSATGEYPPSVLGSWSLGRHGNLAAGRLAASLVDKLYGNVISELRERLGLPAVGAGTLRRRRTENGWPVLHGYSPSVLPRPSDWRAGLDVVGYWWPRRDLGWRPPGDLVDFLEAGPPPVVVGFGSFLTNRRNAARLSEHVVGALRTAGVRGILQAGWAGLAASGEDVLTVGEVPHDWLLHKAAALVHACGAGTTAAGMRAGIPMIGVPVTGDQPFWARKLRDHGMSPATVPYWRLSAKRLAAAVEAAVGDPSYRERARHIAARLAREDGAGAVVKAVESLAR